MDIGDGFKGFREYEQYGRREWAEEYEQRLEHDALMREVEEARSTRGKRNRIVRLVKRVLGRHRSEQ